MNDGEPRQDILDWMHIKNAPNWRVARPLGPLVAVILSLLFAIALAAAFALLIRTFAGSPTSPGANLGTGALIVAILGAPFLIWGTVLKHQTVRYQKEGHITDRINKAVEQLGAEKNVDRIGRPATIWTVSGGHAPLILHLRGVAMG
ncbi:hypothetical protein ACSSV4_003244 [Roseovarius sp. MBR-154]|jgi:hypothetical protein